MLPMEKATMLLERITNNIGYKIQQIDNIEYIVVVLLFIVFAAGCVLMMYDEVKKQIFAWQQREARSKKEQKRSAHREGEFIKSIQFMLAAALNIPLSKKAAYIFVGVCGGAGLLVLFLAYRVTTLVMAIVFGCIVAAIPYLFLRWSVYRKRNKASYEAENLIGGILMHYRLTNFNMEKAMENLIADKSLKDLDRTRPLLFSLLQKFRLTKNPAELREACDVFSYAIGTNWSKMLAHNIYAACATNTAYARGLNVEMSLDDILVQLREAREVVEKSKRSNSESGRMLFITPLIYLLLLYMAHSTCKMTWAEILYNQFGTKLGMIMFVLMVLSFFGTWLLLNMTKTRRLDF